MLESQNRLLRFTQVTALLILVALGALMYYYLGRFEAAERLVEQHREVIDEIQQARTAALRSGIWLRNHAVAPSPEMLDRVRASAREGTEAVQRLVELTRDQPEQHLNAHALVREMGDLFEAYLTGADFAEQKGVSALEPILNSRVQVDHTRRVRERLEGMERLERHTLQNQLVIEKQQLVQVKKLLLLVASVVAGVLLWSTWHSWQLLRMRNAALARVSADPLTGLLNQREFHQQLGELVQRVSQAQRQAALLLFDLDTFKEVNDAHGHEAGNKVLQVLTERLQQQCRSQDLVARLGGDEFAVALGAVASREGASKVAERILAKLGEPIELNGATVQLTASAGIAMLPADGQDPESLLQAADAGLYRAKQGGKGRVGYGLLKTG